MDSSEQKTSSRFSNLDPEQAATLLRRRLMTLGGTIGAVMGLIWSFIASMLFKLYPSTGSVPFLVLTFLAIVFLGGSGLLVGRYVYTKIMSGRG